MEIDNEGMWLGGKTKYAITMECQGFDMNEDDWRVTVSRGPKKVVFTPQNAVYEEGEGNKPGQWYICLDSRELGPGKCYITFEALVPDDDFEDGIRNEIMRYELININSL